MMDIRDPQTGFTDAQAAAMIEAHAREALIPYCEAHGIDYRSAYDVVLGRSYAQAQYRRIIDGGIVRFRELVRKGQGGTDEHTR